MVNEIVEELLDLDMEPKPELLTSTLQSRGHEDFACGRQRQIVGSPFCDVFDVLGYRFHRDGKGVQGAEAQVVQGPEKLVA